jgi:hypothetical protein
MRDWQRIVEDLFARLDGPLHFRLIVQPLMATIFAVIDGVKDAKTGKPAYFWALLTTPGYRKELVKEGWKSVGKIFILAIVLDVVYQVIVHSSVYPGELLLVAFVLAILPYLVVRGPVNRVMRLGKNRTFQKSSSAGRESGEAGPNSVKADKTS